MSKLKNREEFEGGLKKPEEFEETSNKSPKKQGRTSTGGDNFSTWPEYTPLDIYYNISTQTLIKIVKSSIFYQISQNVK